MISQTTTKLYSTVVLQLGHAVSGNLGIQKWAHFGYFGFTDSKFRARYSTFYEGTVSIIIV